MPQADPSPADPVQPVDVLRLAAIAGVDPDSEPRLLHVLRRVLGLPLPPTWRRVRDPDAPELGAGGSPGRLGGFFGGRPVVVKFFNAMDGRTVLKHPAEDYLTEQLVKYRQRCQLLVSRGASADDVLGTGGKAGAWMQFVASPRVYSALTQALPKQPALPSAPASPVPGEDFFSASLSRPSLESLPEAAPAGEDDVPARATFEEAGESKGLDDVYSTSTAGAAAKIGAGAGAGAGAGSGAGVGVGTGAGAGAGADDTEASAGLSRPTHLRLDGGDSDDDEVERTYFFDFHSRTVSLFLPDDAVLLPQPPSEQYVKQQLMAPALPRSPLKARHTESAATLDRTGATGASAASAASAADGECNQLVFTSWWNEVETMAQSEAHSSVFRRQTITLVFNMLDGSCELSLAGDSKVYVLPQLEGATGAPLECWDLYVGAIVPLMGRKTTLKQASAATQEWNEAHAVRLRKLLAMLKKELAKYNPGAVHKHEPRRKLQGKAAGSANLREMLQLAHRLRGCLAEYRPKLADKLLQDLL